MLQLLLNAYFLYENMYIYQKENYLYIQSGLPWLALCYLQASLIKNEVWIKVKG